MSRPRWSRWRTAGVVAAVLGLGAAGLRWGPALCRLLANRETVQRWVAGFGLWGPLASVLLNAAQVLLAPIPGQTVGVVNGYLYGVGWGTFYSLLGVELGSALAMGLARLFGRPLVERLVGAKRLARWDGIARRQGPAFFFLVFLLPFVPDDVVCFLIGLSPLSIPYMLLLAAVGRLPGLVVSSWVGANATELPWWGWGAVGAGSAVLAILFWKYRERLERGVVSWVGGVTRRQGEGE